MRTDRWLASGMTRSGRGSVSSPSRTTGGTTRSAIVALSERGGHLGLDDRRGGRTPAASDGAVAGDVEDLQVLGALGHEDDPQARWRSTASRSTASIAAP